MAKQTIGALVFPGFELLDLYGPLEMFGFFTEHFEIQILSRTSDPVASRAGPRTLVDVAWGEGCSGGAAWSELNPGGIAAPDLLLVPGGPGTRALVDEPVTLAWLADIAPKAGHTLSVCTGSALLARAGVLDGLHATTNKAAFAWVESQGPQVHWVRQARWVKDGSFYSSSGVSAGIDMALAVIADLLGRAQAEQAALWAEYTWHDDPGRDPFAGRHGLI
ncbi:DJ-1/PfpI family protein [Tistlia consotensis]|uniref:DJ-1/PfpI family protein n=1 Tax=Tistlia consotensis USBA 355 TaxID=560819 RepID=A0A1Y6CGW6_9PROT|nr:DJ-1/PfpI family protein [Tistlia consotensis]SMF64579.1 DJ-1/PfpI family protein [Tistlia consotensis USBA 355]SNR97300.1 DJ-1/PfpI family protein [Tistlia consotensis]